MAEVKLQLSGSRDCDEGPLDDGISCHKGWGFLRAALGDSHSIDRVPSVSKSESGTEVCRWLVFRGWVLSLAREWEEYSNYLGEGAGISRSWASPAFGPFMASNLPAYARDAGVTHSRKQTHSEGQCR